MERYFLYAMGSTCYDKTGITYPQTESLDLVQMIKDGGGKNIRWAKQFGYNNLPKVITVTLPEKDEKQKKMRQELAKRGLLFLVHWNNDLVKS